MTPSDDNKSMTHDSWIDTFETLVERNGIETAVGEVGYFCAQVLRRCGHTPEHKEFIDQRTLKAFENVEATRGTR